MPIFDYKGRDSYTGLLKEGKIKAASREAAADYLREQHHIDLALLDKQPREHRSLSDLVQELRPVDQRVLVSFTRCFSTMTGAGIRSYDALEAAEQNETNPKMRRALRDVIEQVGSGIMFSDAFSRHPKIFDGFYCAIVRSGEERGDLPEAMEMLAGQLEQKEKMRRAIRSATRYPRIVSAVSIAAATAALLSLGRKR